MMASWQRILERDRTFTIQDGAEVVGGGSVYSFALSICRVAPSCPRAV